MENKQPINKEPFIDLDALLAPITNTHEGGTFIHYDPIFDQIMAARFEENQNLPQGIWVTRPKYANWLLVNQLCQQVLKTKSKDLQIASWLLEAQFYLNGIPGFIQGLNFIEELCLRFWDTMYPQLGQNGDPDFRLAPIEWLNHKFSNKLLEVIITSPSDSTQLKYSMANFIHAKHLEHLSKQPKYGVNFLNEAKKNSEVTLDVFLQSREKTPLGFYEDLINDLNQALNAVLHLDELLMKKTNDPTSFFYKLRENLNSIKHFAECSLQEKHKEDKQSLPFQMKKLLQKIGVHSKDFSNSPSSPIPPLLELTSDHEAVQKPTDLPLTLTNRTQAYLYLEQILTYLKQTEV